MLADLYGPPAAWPALYSCDVSSESPSGLAFATQAATEMCWALSGRMFGLRTVTLRPCRRACYEGPWPDGWMPWPGSIPPPLGAGPGSVVGWWTAAACAGCGPGCGCAQISDVQLPGPVNSIVEVKLDGQTMPSGSYLLYDGQDLIRTDGRSWPTCQTLTAPDTAVGTWSITAKFGRDVPVSGQYAVGEFACEYLRAARGEDCRLPRNVTSLIRQGVTVQMPMLSDQLKAGMTGLPMVDYFLGVYNPTGSRSRSKVYAVDQPRHRRVGA
jgi:hypothetical protein